MAGTQNISPAPLAPEPPGETFTSLVFSVVVVVAAGAVGGGAATRGAEHGPQQGRAVPPDPQRLYRPHAELCVRGATTGTGPVWGKYRKACDVLAKGKVGCTSHQERDWWLIYIAGDGLGLWFWFLSCTEIGSRDLSPNLCNVNMFCIVQCRHWVWNPNPTPSPSRSPAM